MDTRRFCFNHNGSRERERLGIEQFIERRVDAVLFTNPRAEENLKLLRPAYAAAISVVMLVLLFVASILTLRLRRKD